MSFRDNNKLNEIMAILVCYLINAFKPSVISRRILIDRFHKILDINALLEIVEH